MGAKRSWRVVALAALLLCAGLPARIAVAAAADDRTDRGWALRLADSPRDQRLELHLDSGRTLVGYPVAVGADSVALAASPGGPATASAATAEILAVRREGSGAARGWRVGEATGVVLGALAGLFFSAVIDAVEEEGETQPVAYAGLAVGLATTGAVVAGGLGALIGSSGRAWYPLHAGDDDDRAGARLRASLGLAGRNDLDGDGYDDIHLGVALPWRLTSVVELGPEATWSRLGRRLESWDGRTATIGDTWSAGAVARLSPPSAGLAPFATVGVAWYGREDTWLGGSFGIGMRWRHRHGHEVSVEVRNHFRSTGIDPVPSDGFFAATAGLTWRF